MHALASSRALDALPLLVRAFDEDPLFRFFAPEKETRARFVGEVMRTNLEMTAPRGHARVVEDPVLRAACLWVPPGGQPKAASVASIRAAAVARTLARWARHGREAARIGDALRVATLMEEAHPKEPHYYLQVLAVDPPWHGRGLGSAMLREIAREADRDGVPAVLETAKALNVALYRRHGFEVVRETRVASSPPLWTMLRAPRSEL